MLKLPPPSGSTAAIADEAAGAQDTAGIMAESEDVVEMESEIVSSHLDEEGGYFGQ